MKLLFPAGLLLMALVLPLILLRRRRQPPVRVSSFYFFERLHPGVQTLSVRPRLDRRRLLPILGVILLGLAAAEPVLERTEPRVLAVRDVTASECADQQAASSRASALEKATASRPDGSPVLYALAGSRLELLGSGLEAADRFKGATCADEADPAGRRLEDAATLAGLLGDTNLLVSSSRVDLPGVAPSGINAPSDASPSSPAPANVALTALLPAEGPFGLRQRPSVRLESTGNATVTVRAASLEPVSCVLGTPTPLGPALSITPDQSLALALPPTLTGLVAVWLEPEGPDALAADDAVVLQLPEAAPPGIEVQGDPAASPWQTLGAVIPVARAPLSADCTTAPDSARASVRAAPFCSALAPAFAPLEPAHPLALEAEHPFALEADTLVWDAGGERAAAVREPASGRSPLLEGIPPLTGVILPGVSPRPLPAGAEAVLELDDASGQPADGSGLPTEASGQAVVLTRTIGDHRLLSLGFDLEALCAAGGSDYDDDLCLSFTQLIANFLREAATPPAMAEAAGGTLAGAGWTRCAVSRGSARLEPVAGTRADRVGVYVNGEVVRPVNLVSSSESRLVEEAIQIGATDTGTEQREERHPVSRWLELAAALALGAYGLARPAARREGP